MGLMDLLGGKRKLAQPAADRLFAISTAYVTFQTAQEITSRGTAAIVFQSLTSADFREIVTDMEAVVRATAADSKTTVETTEDDYGFSWLVLRQPDLAPGATDQPDEPDQDQRFEDLVVGVNAVSTALEAGGYGERILCAVFAFHDSRDRGIYWIYNYKRGHFYPFVPTSDQRRDNERELILKAQNGSELPIEPELSRWYPLWGIPV